MFARPIYHEQYRTKIFNAKSFKLYLPGPLNLHQTWLTPNAILNLDYPFAWCSAFWQATCEAPTHPPRNQFRPASITYGSVRRLLCQHHILIGIIALISWANSKHSMIVAATPSIKWNCCMAHWGRKAYITKGTLERAHLSGALN